jgi:hypothetical protein
MTVLTAVGLVLLGLILAIVGGAVSGMRIGGEYLGQELAAMMGAFFGPASVVPAVALGVVILALFR